MEDKKRKFCSAAREVRCEHCNHILWLDRGTQLEIKFGNRYARLNREHLPNLGSIECCGLIRKFA
jgi:hypothetical protein